MEKVGDNIFLLRLDRDVTEPVFITLTTLEAPEVMGCRFEWRPWTWQLANIPAQNRVDWEPALY